MTDTIQKNAMLTANNHALHIMYGKNDFLIIPNTNKEVSGKTDSDIKKHGSSLGYALLAAKDILELIEALGAIFSMNIKTKRPTTVSAEMSRQDGSDIWTLVALTNSPKVIKLPDRPNTEGIEFPQVPIVHNLEKEPAPTSYWYFSADPDCETDTDIWLPHDAFVFIKK